MKIVLYLPKLWNDEPRIKAVTEKNSCFAQEFHLFEVEGEVRQRLICS